VTDVALVGGVPVLVRPDNRRPDVSTAPAPVLVIGYYPVPGWPAGTVQAWDGESWHEPITVPGFYAQADGQLEWWNGHCWVGGVPVPRVLAAVPEPSPPPRPALQPRAKRAHARRRRTRPLHAATTVLATITALGMTGRR